MGKLNVHIAGRSLVYDKDVDDIGKTIMKVLKEGE